MGRRCARPVMLLPDGPQILVQRPLRQTARAGDPHGAHRKEDRMTTATVGPAEPKTEHRRSAADAKAAARLIPATLRSAVGGPAGQRLRETRLPYHNALKLTDLNSSVATDPQDLPSCGVLFQAGRPVGMLTSRRIVHRRRWCTPQALVVSTR